MNDFTKEELEEIAECVWIHNDLRDNDPATYSPLLKKIKSMIDNYCEHQWRFYINSQGSNVICQKCSVGLI